jgi:hypothetical protein
MYMHLSRYLNPFVLIVRVVFHAHPLNPGLAIIRTAGIRYGCA